ncbi:AAA family ATPase [Chloroflexota bacterium]
MTVITLSRQLGGCGEEIAAGVAKKRSLRLVDVATINQAAERAGVPTEALVALGHEGERGLANRVLTALRTMPSLQSMTSMSPARSGDTDATSVEQSAMTMPFSGFFSPTAPPISASLESYVHMVGLVVRGLASEGDVLIVGRGGQVLLKNHPSAFHVQIVAPSAFRIRVVNQRLGLDKKAAQNRVRDSDRARSDYLRRYHDVNWLDSTLYHLVINTGRVSMDLAMDLVISGSRAVAQSGDGTGVNG